MTTPDTPAGRATEQFMLLVRRKRPDIATHDYNGVYSVALDHFEKQGEALNAAPAAGPTDERLREELLKVIHDEIGGYEATHPAINGVSAAIFARVMITLTPLLDAQRADSERLDWIMRYWDSQATGLQPLGLVKFYPNPTGSYRDAIDAAKAALANGGHAP